MNTIKKCAINAHIYSITDCHFFSLNPDKYSLLGVRKDYWNFISECIPKDDGVRLVHAIPQVLYTYIFKIS